MMSVAWAREEGEGGSELFGGAEETVMEGEGLARAE